MARTLAEIKNEHARLQTVLNSIPADKDGARNKIMGDMRKLQAEHDMVKSGKSKKEKSSPMVMYMVVGAIAVIGISFAVAFFAGSKY